VTYYYVDIYLSTLRYFEHLPMDTLYSGHWPTMHGEEIRDFIAESRQTVEFLDRVILTSLEKSRAGLSMKELVDAVANAKTDVLLALPLHRMKQQNAQRRDQAATAGGQRPQRRRVL